MRLMRPAVRTLLATALLFACSSAVALPTSYPTGTTYYDPQKAWNGFVLLPGNDNKTHLIDMNGNEVHRWDFESFPPWPLQPDQARGQHGHILVQKERLQKTSPVANPGNGMLNASVAEVDWQGKVVWQWGSQQSPVHQHHEMRRLDNGNTLILDAQLRKLPGFDYPIIDNSIDEVSPQGRVVWHWSAGDNLEQFGFTAEQIQMIKDSSDPDFLHFNTASPVGPDRWFDGGDKRFAPDNIMLNSRNANVAVIIDRHTGKVVWRIGPEYPALQLGKPLPRPLDQTIGAHDLHIIPKGLPGAGNLLMFDNQGNAGFPPSRQGFFSASRIIEVNPVSKQIVWEYDGEKSGQAIWSFYSAFISSAQRLPNGNTLIDEGQHGRLFQVTPSGEIVWEYVSPWFGRSMPRDRYITNQVYRAQLVDYGWAPLGTPHQEKAVKADCVRYPVAPGCFTP
ncbi:aryl-sulfate sulfotransferase [Pantoea sp. BAV 3049]|uniref:aryl-sulfate sulfotransferase n=1 Tax=Pantoea sp. BAV 3049 TaxID=2654188 RepID=UPI00131A6D65|nr:aryl-sulfate sulfotransferase [Pantoea sp. BAV 3049]